MQHFWRDFEKCINCKLPRVIKKNFDLCGIDKAVLSLINEQTIIDIEKIVNENKNVLNKSDYEIDKEFKFSYGHRTLILSLPERYNNFCKDKIERNKYRKEHLTKLKANSNNT